MGKALPALAALTACWLIACASPAAAAPPAGLGHRAITSADGAVLVGYRRWRERFWGHPWYTVPPVWFARRPPVIVDAPIYPEVGVLPLGVQPPVIYYPPNAMRYSSPPVVLNQPPPLVDYSDLDYDLAPYRYYMRHQPGWWGEAEAVGGEAAFEK